MNYNTLEKNKNMIMKVRKRTAVFMSLYIGFCVMPWLLLSVWTSMSILRILPVILAFIALAIPLMLDIVKTNSLIKQVSFVEEMNGIKEVYDVKLDNPRFFFLSDGGNKTYKHCYGIGLKSKDKKKYYILFDGLKVISYYEDLETLVSIFSREFTLQCYEGTTIVKTVDNAPFCLEDKYTPVYKPFIKK